MDTGRGFRWLSGLQSACDIDAHDTHRIVGKGARVQRREQESKHSDNDLHAQYYIKKLRPRGNRSSTTENRFLGHGKSLCADENVGRLGGGGSDKAEFRKDALRLERNGI